MLFSLGKEPPNHENPPRFEQSVGLPFVEINLKQKGNEVIHLPVHHEYAPGQVVVEAGVGINCHSDMKTYTGMHSESLWWSCLLVYPFYPCYYFVLLPPGEWNNPATQSVKGCSADPNQSLDVEVHFIIHYRKLHND
jgi:hypothetical protein